jgi:hypothetical protein
MRVPVWLQDCDLPNDHDAGLQSVIDTSWLAMHGEVRAALARKLGVSWWNMITRFRFCKKLGDRPKRPRGICGPRQTPPAQSVSFKLSVQTSIKGWLFIIISSRNWATYFSRYTDFHRQGLAS